IDRETHLPLKLNLMDGKQVLQQIMFTQVQYPDAIPDQAFKPTYDISDYRVIDHKPATADGDAAIMQVRWHAKSLPPGFEQVETGMRTTSGGQAVQQL